MRTLLLQDAEDLLYGAAIYGTGGGGSLDEALAKVRSLYAAGKSITLIEAEEVGDDWLIASPYYVGSVSPPSEEVMRRFAGLPEIKQDVSTLAAKALEKYLGKPIQAVIATELGGNTACAMETAVNLGVPLVDADPAGRAVPDLAHTTFHLYGVSIAPFALANRYGDTMIVQETVNHGHAEMIARNFAIVFGNMAGVCDHPVTGRRLKEAVIVGTLSQSQQLGRAMRLANERGESAVRAIAEAGRGTLLLEGVIRHADWQDEKGFTEGNVIVEPLAMEERSEPSEPLSLWFRNEHMVARKGERIVSIVPELITVLDRKTGMPILNPDCRPGMEVAVLTFPAPTAWESEKGISIFGPSYIGMNSEIYYGLKRGND